MIHDTLLIAQDFGACLVSILAAMASLSDRASGSGHFRTHLKGEATKPRLAKLLYENSGSDVEWLLGKFSLDLSLVPLLGGHSAPRTHRGKERFDDGTLLGLEQEHEC